MCLTGAAVLNEIADFGRTDRTIEPITFEPAGVLTNALGDPLVSSMMDSVPSLSVAPDTELVRSRRVAASATAWRVVVPLSGVVFLGMLPVTLIVPALKELLVDRFAASPFWTHAFMSINLIGGIAAAPLMIRLSSRGWQRRRVIVGAFLVDAILMGAMAVLPSLTAVLIARFFEGAAHLLAITSLMALAADWAGSGNRGRVMGMLGAAMMFGTACGTRVGGLAWQVWPGRTFELAACFALATAVFAAVGLREASTRQARTGLRDMMATLSKQRRLFVPFAYALLDRFCVGVVISTFVLYLATVGDMGPNGRSRLLVMFLFPFALLVYPAGRLCDRIGRIWPLALGSIAFGLVFATYGLIPIRLLPVAMVASGVLSALMFAPNLALCADLAAPEHRSLAYAGFNVAGSLGFLCGPLLGGILATVLAGTLPLAQIYAVTFVLAGATECIGAIVSLPFLLALRRDGQTR